ncbi:branched-chain amino acid ABC transporter permease [Nonomuraea sp. MCN248]|uniref:Branched-chain amino acid ABC transporter permease n=1 Tax=Nonomuraea corallina TaxID=2989783 RepID=A0ABT4SFX1_9ACTN|nr:branched-chain amino acid ABC transporter permease [Nonomuraea corallina]MDA0636098.1 branched-chain amino acid ABC transporter permease [Nonomuraea corallina]
MFDWLEPLQLFRLDTALILTLLVVSVHVTFRVGIMSLAPMGFAAVGGYTAALISTRTELPFAVGLLAATLFAGAIGALFAPPVLRLRGIYMALGSLALAQAIVVLIRISDFTNGPNGIAGIPVEVRTEYLVIALVVAFVVLELGHRSYFGRAAKAVRLDERTAEGLGINVFRVRFVAFTAAAAIAGCAGALEAHRTMVISPDQYGFATLVIVFTYVLVGGNGHWAGPVLLTWGLTILRDMLHVAGSYWEDIVYGVLLVLVLLVAPNGLSDRSLYRGLRRRWRGRANPSPTIDEPAEKVASR